ncbi:MAG: hypothetical protein RSG52_09720 [Terrisporobacter sp.]|uniref:hypothetical protein n=1 Tax=Terrisporobacter sp. TaxID=1965305 RepID=UPI002FC8EBB8
MKWINVKNVDELKALGKFTEVKDEIKKDLGENFKLTGRGWDDLFNKILNFSHLIDQINNSNKEPLNKLDNNINTSAFFTSQASEYIFYLTELDGELRMKKLGITKSHFTNKNKAKTWRDKISKEIHPDINNHPKSSLAMSKLNDMYSSMVGKNK